MIGVAGYFPHLPPTPKPSYLKIAVDAERDSRPRMAAVGGKQLFECVCGVMVFYRLADVLGGKVAFCGAGCRRRVDVVGSKLEANGGET